MAFDWKEYLSLAYFLDRRSGTNFSSEASSRAAISRAYYAAFCHARNYARDYDGFVPIMKVKDHEYVREHFRQNGQSNIAMCLDELRQWRNYCDYYDIVYALPQRLKSALQNAQDIIDKLK